MSTKSLWMIPGLVVVLAGSSSAQQPAASNVSEILGQHDRALIRELGAYLKQNPKADDRDQGFAALFNKAIEHDWFADNEEAALRYLKNDPDGPVKARRRSSPRWPGPRPAATTKPWHGTRS